MIPNILMIDFMYQFPNDSVLQRTTDVERKAI